MEKTIELDKSFINFWKAESDKLNRDWSTEDKIAIEQVVIGCIKYRRPEDCTTQCAEKYIRSFIMKYFSENGDVELLSYGERWLDRTATKLNHNVEVVADGFLYAYNNLVKREKFFLFGLHEIGVKLNQLNGKETGPFTSLKFFEEYLHTNDRDFSDSLTPTKYRLIRKISIHETFNLFKDEGILIERTENEFLTMIVESDFSEMWSVKGSHAKICFLIYYLRNLFSDDWLNDALQSIGLNKKKLFDNQKCVSISFRKKWSEMKIKP